ncbi:von Willebrand factor type A domain-containing protein [Yoonia sp. R2331]|uniref:vWA domain-containing protein n=1 Tax=Yoonia sp. R2331 TaxID=3237238 RepID=UPI0034E424E5
MTDDLDDIKSLMNSATPRPDAQRRAENLMLAQENFDALQGSRPVPRPTSRNFFSGVKTMLDTLTTKGGLTATTALVAVGFLFVTPMGQDLWQGAPPATSKETIRFGGQASLDGEGDAGGFFFDADVAPQSPNETATITATPQPQDNRAEADDFATLQSTEAAPGLAPEVMEAPVVVIDSLAAATPSPTQDLAVGGMVAAEAPLAQTRTRAQGQTLSLVAPAPPVDAIQPTEPNTEAFPEATPNPLKITAETPVSTFSIDVDTAAYSVVRSSLMRGQLPPKDAVRVEEMINYFPYDYPAPDAGEAPFRPTVSTMATPWNPDTQLVHIALQGQLPAVETRPPLNLVFLIDTSGSMNDPAKLPLLRQSFLLMLDQLRPEDEVAIVTYAGSAGQILAPTAASDRAAITRALNSLGAGGSTNGVGGLEQAYQVAEGMAAEGEVNRVILATDGDFNVGIHDPDALTDFIADKRDTGTYLSVLGFGRGNLDDATMQALAQNGNGTAAYIDTLSEAQKVLVDQLTGALFTIAGDVKIQVEWNPAQIAEYRLIGYETRALNREDFNNDKVDAGELGAGHSVTAIYEVTPVGSPAQLSDPLRYQPEAVAETSEELGFLKLRYKAPGEEVSQLLSTPITASDAGAEAQFAAAIAGFGQLLRGETYLGEWSYLDAIALANGARGMDPFGYRTEAVQLMRLANSLDQ